MGRRSGGSSGGGRSSGSSSGGRSSGSSSGGGSSRSFGSSSSGSRSFGFSGSSRSSGSSGSSRSRSSGFGTSSRTSSSFGTSSSGSGNSSYSGSPVRYPSSGSSYSRVTGRGSSRDGCLKLLLILIVIVGVISLLGYLAVGRTPNVERQPLKGSVDDKGYYTDTTGLIKSQSTLTKGMKSFYKETGIQPYLVLTNEINGNNSPGDNEALNYTENLYDQLFSDESHFLLVFLERNGNYQAWFITGARASSVLDEGAEKVFLAKLNKYYGKYSSYDEYFSKTFSETAAEIMKVKKSSLPSFLITLGVAFAIIAGIYFFQKSREQKRIEAEETERILRTPLETFGDSEAEKLAKKYDEEPPSQGDAKEPPPTPPSVKEPTDGPVH